MILYFLVSFVFLVAAMSVHEFSHGWVAYRLGDPTAKYSGRLTLNPLAHIDPVWTFLLPLFFFLSTRGSFIFGAAKPVPINYWALRNPKRDILWVGLAGPAANLIFAFLLSLALKPVSSSAIAAFILANLIRINVVLGVFNLIPIPPLDGSRILMGLLPQNTAFRYAGIEPFGFIILMFLVWTGIIGNIIYPIIEKILMIFGVAY